MSEEQYLSRIKQLEKEIEYLHGLLDDAGISYRRKAKDLDDLSPDRNLAFEEDQGARIHKVTITKQHIQYERDLLEANREIIIASPGLNQAKVNAFVKLIKRKQEDGVKVTVVTLNPEGYPEEKIEDTKNLVQTLEKCGIKIRLRDQMHEHFVIIDGEIVWYGSMNFLSRAKDDDNLIRLKSKDAAQELMEMTFG